MSCGNCYGCDNCYGSCPDATIIKNTGVIKTGPGGYQIDYGYCKGGGIYAAECPSCAIAKVPEDTWGASPPRKMPGAETAPGIFVLAVRQGRRGGP